MYMYVSPTDYLDDQRLLMTPPHGDHLLHPSPPRSRSCSPQVSPASLSPTQELSEVHVHEYIHVHTCNRMHIIHVHVIIVHA